jgi:hypothetical protein
LVHGLLDRGTVALLSGKFGTYKSFLALDIACHVALGRAWQGHDVDEAVPVVYIAAEGDTGMQVRLWGWETVHHEGEPLPDSQLAVIPHRVVLETGKDGKATAPLKELVAAVNQRGAGLVVFDTLSKSRASGTEENSNSDMAAVMALVIELCRATGATVLLVAHTGYSGEHIRGASAQEDDVDTSLLIMFEDPRSEDRSPTNRRVLHHRKAKDGVLAAPRVLTPSVVVLGHDEHGRVIDTLTLTTDPFESAGGVEGPRGGTSMESALAEYERRDAPRGMSQTGLKAWLADATMKGRWAVLWEAYKEYREGSEQDQLEVIPDPME